MGAQKPQRPPPGHAMLLPRTGEDPDGTSVQRAFDAVQVTAQQVQKTIAATQDAVAAVGGGRLLAIQVLTGSGTYVPTPGTTRAIIEGVACGGGGGGAGGGGNPAIGGGGASGEYFRAVVGIEGVTLTGGAYSAPTSGGAGGSSAGGNAAAGSDASLLIAGTTYTLKGGAGGLGTASAAPPLFAGPGRAVVGTASGLVLLRDDGEMGFSVTASVFWGGRGGSTPLGPGGGVGDASGGSSAGHDASGYGGGGGGACVNGTGKAGGAGGAAVWFVHEFS